MTTPRVEKPQTADEAAMLTAFLDFHRETLALKCDGLTPDQLRLRSVAPSNLSLLGLIRHMSEVERHWFRSVLDGQEFGKDGIYWTEADPDGDFDNVGSADVTEAFGTWRRQVELARAAAAGLPLDTVARKQRHGEPVTLRWIFVHMIEEYARHNGHADLLRESIDGVTGE